MFHSPRLPYWANLINFSQIVNLGVSREQAIQTLTAAGGNGEYCTPTANALCTDCLLSLQWIWLHRCYSKRQERISRTKTCVVGVYEEYKRLYSLC